MVRNNQQTDSRTNESGRALIRRLLLSALNGALIGCLVGVIGGGLIAAIWGLPFAGTKGWQGFLGGLYFPGLVIGAPVTGTVGCVLLLATTLFKVMHNKRRSRTN